MHFFFKTCLLQNKHFLLTICQLPIYIYILFLLSHIASPNTDRSSGGSDLLGMRGLLRRKRTRGRSCRIRRREPGGSGTQCAPEKHNQSTHKRRRSSSQHVWKSRGQNHTPVWKHSPFLTFNTNTRTVSQKPFS